MENITNAQLKSIETRVHNIEIKIQNIENILEKIYTITTNIKTDTDIIVSHINFINNEYNTVREPVRILCNFVTNFKNKIHRIPDFFYSTILNNDVLTKIDLPISISKRKILKSVEKKRS